MRNFLNAFRPERPWSVTRRTRIELLSNKPLPSDRCGSFGVNPSLIRGWFIQGFGDARFSLREKWCRPASLGVTSGSVRRFLTGSVCVNSSLSDGSSKFAKIPVPNCRHTIGARLSKCEMQFAARQHAAASNHPRMPKMLRFSLRPNNPCEEARCSDVRKGELFPIPVRASGSQGGATDYFNRFSRRWR